MVTNPAQTTAMTDAKKTDETLDLLIHSSAEVHVKCKVDNSVASAKLFSMKEQAGHQFHVLVTSFSFTLIRGGEFGAP